MSGRLKLDCTSCSDLRVRQKVIGPKQKKHDIARGADRLQKLVLLVALEGMKVMLPILKSYRLPAAARAQQL